MPSIGSQGYPLVFSVADERGVVNEPAGRVSVRAEVRSLEGMQKEALIRVGAGRAWRMVSDEGPYLNGTDLAPFPLAFFTAGMQFSFLSRLLQAALARSIVMRSVTVAQDNFYSMEGSFLRGDATGGATPARVDVEIDSDAGPDQVAALVRSAGASSGAHALMRDSLTNAFALRHNGTRCPVDGLSASRANHDEAPSFEHVMPDTAHPALEDIITKVGVAAWPVARTADARSRCARSWALPLQQGRFLEETDRAGQPLVAVINRAMVDKRFAGRTPLGQLITLRGEAREIVGVVADVSQTIVMVSGGSSETVYVPIAQMPLLDPFLLLATTGDPSQLAGPTRTALAEVDPDLTVNQVQTMEQFVDQFFVGIRVFNSLLGGSGHWLYCWLRSARTGCSPTRSVSAGRRSACVWHWVHGRVG